MSRRTVALPFCVRASPGRNRARPARSSAVRRAAPAPRRRRLRGLAAAAGLAVDQLAIEVAHLDLQPLLAEEVVDRIGGLEIGEGEDALIDRRDGQIGRRAAERSTRVTGISTFWRGITLSGTVICNLEAARRSDRAASQATPMARPGPRSCSWPGRKARRQHIGAGAPLGDRPRSRSIVPSAGDRPRASRGHDRSRSRSAPGPAKGALATEICRGLAGLVARPCRRRPAAVRRARRCPALPTSRHRSAWSWRPPARGIDRPRGGSCPTAPCRDACRARPLSPTACRSGAGFASDRPDSPRLPFCRTSVVPFLARPAGSAACRPPPRVPSALTATTSNCGIAALRHLLVAEQRLDAEIERTCCAPADRRVSITGRPPNS